MRRNIAFDDEQGKQAQTRGPQTRLKMANFSFPFNRKTPGLE
jgi:hypothetical protein